MNREFDAFLKKVYDAVNDWYAKQCQECGGVYHVYWSAKVPPDICGDVVIAIDPPLGYVLGNPTRISPAWERRHALRFISEWARQWPVL